MFAKPFAEMTADEAGCLVDAVDRGQMKVERDVYDDLLLVASGHAALFLDKRAADGPKIQNCAVCGRSFEVLRRSAMYCSAKCRQKGKRHASRASTDATVLRQSTQATQDASRASGRT